MAIRQKPENTIEFSEKGITIYLTKAIYDAIEKVARTEYKDTRSVLGVVQTYAVIQAYSRLSYTNKFVPIHRDIFQFISKRNYTAYRDLLCKYNIIEYRKSEYTTYKTIKGENRISSTTTEYRMASVIGVLFDNDKTVPVHIPMPSNYISALQKKHKHIGEEYIDAEDKSKSIMEVNPIEIMVVDEIARLVKDVIFGKIKTQRTFQKIVDKIDTINKQINSNSDLCDLIKRLIRVSNNKHIAGNNLIQEIGLQSVKHPDKCNNKFHYYKELQAKCGALDECLTKRDLYHLSRINTIPNYGSADKIYSALANIRKPIREFVTFRGAKLVEVGDVSCAHFTMLPVIFKRYGIAIPSEELQRWIELTQSADLYGAVIEGTDISRSAIKATFQPFLSIKNKKQFLYGQEGEELRKREILCDYFEAHFPAIFNALLSWHTLTDVSIKSVANQVESDIMNPICDRLITEGLHPFRIHDAIYLPDNEVPRLNLNIKEEVFERINNDLCSANPTH